MLRFAMQALGQQKSGGAYQAWPEEKQQYAEHQTPEFREVPPKPGSDIYNATAGANVEERKEVEARQEKLPRYSQVMRE